MILNFTPQGVCSRNMEIELEGDTVVSLKVTGGCHGNSQGLSALVAGMKAADVVARLEGIHCGLKGTSCPDQLTKALCQAAAEN